MSDTSSHQPDSSDESKSIEGRKLQLEIDKFEFEKSKGHGLGFFNANFGIIITGMIGLATIVVSYLQLQISRQSSLQQLQLQGSISVAQLDLEKSKAQAEKDKDERALQFDIARLLLEKQTDINTMEVRRVYYLRDIVMSTLPSDIGLKITRKMADNAADEGVRSAWLDGFVKLSVVTTVPAVAGSQVPLTVDFALAQMSAPVAPDAKPRVQDIIDAAVEFKVQDATALILAFALFNTNSFQQMVENLDYSTQRLMQVFPSRFPTGLDAAPFAHNPSGLADKIYEKRMGNIDPDDGWKYRGRGYLQATGKSSYAQSGARIGVDLVANPDKLVESKVAAREIAANFAALGPPITVDGAVRKFNGGLFGLAGIQAIFEKLAPGTPKVTQGLSIPTADSKTCQSPC